MITEEKKLWAAKLLQEKYDELGRMPKKDDFDEVTRARIKAFLGPWPRALEAAGLKKAKPEIPKSKKRKVKKSKSQQVAAVKRFNLRNYSNAKKNDREE